MTTERDRVIRIGFAGFWDGFDPDNNFFTRLLRRRYVVEVTDQPDFLLHSCVGPQRHDYLQSTCTRIFFTGENRRPDWWSTDWAFTFDYSSHPRHCRLPLWVLYADPRLLVKPPDYNPAAIAAMKTRFCAFVVSNPLGRVRNEFFRRLSKYKPVHSGGAVLNTLGYRVSDKRAFLAYYKFTIAFENESRAGYTTEKLIDPMLVNSIPVYWGDPEVGRDFNTGSMLCAHESRTLDALVERVVEADRNVDRYHALLAEPWFVNNRVPSCADLDTVLDQFTRIFETPIMPVARRHGLPRDLKLHRLPAKLDALRRRLVTDYRDITRND